jgi:hypothetical protein
MDFKRVRLDAPADSFRDLADFYGDRLEIPELTRKDGLLMMQIGETRFELAPGEGRPFYHFALLAPGNRFDELLAWAGERVELLPNPDTGEPVFDFSDWEAQACYFHDPAGSIVELIAHRGVGETGAQGAFEAAELLGFSELGLVGNTTAMAGLLRVALGLELWDGTVDEEGRLAFVGEPARTLILAPPGRGWIPTGRPAEVHAVAAVLSGSPAREVALEDGHYRISGG